MTSISIVIPVKDDPPIFDAVASVLGQADEIVVVDNGSAPRFRARLESLSPGVRVVDEPVRGPAAARNRGIAESTGDVVFFLDADCVAAPDWAAEGLRALEEARADIVGGRSRAMPATRQARFVVKTWTVTPERIASRVLVYADTKNLAVRRHVFERVRFDERLPRYEDHQFGFEAEAAGFTMIRCPEMTIEFAPDERLALHAAKMMGTGWARAFTVAEGRRKPRRGRRGRRPLGAARELGFYVLRRPAVVRAFARATLIGARAVDVAAPVLPTTAGGWFARRAASFGRTAGMAMHAAGYAAPSTSDLLGGRFPARR